MTNEKEIAMLLFDYINSNYDVIAEIKPRFLYENNIYIATKKYDLNIAIEKPSKEHYLFKKCEYCLFLNYEANKKYRAELHYHGGGHSEAFNENDFSNIDKFLSEWVEKKNIIQTDIFDYIKD